MTEQKTKRRGWVKNAIIIFLVIMLVLTFFSNTIMNRSLPEVATQYTSSGTINAMIRGTGTATANETYEVKVDQTRTVLSTHVSAGEAVEAGTLLFTLQDAASEELETLQDQLEEAEYNYQVALLDASVSSSTQNSRDIERAREDLTIAQQELSLLTDVSLDTISQAKTRVSELKAQLNVLQAEVDKAQSALDALGGRDPGSNNSSAAQAYNEAKTNLDAAKLRYDADYKVLEAIAQALYDKQETKTYSKEAFMKALAEEWKGASSGAGGSGSGSGDEGAVTAAALSALPGTDKVFKDEGNGNITYPLTGGKSYPKADLVTAYETITAANEAYQTAWNAYVDSNSAGNAALYDLRKRELDTAQANYNKVNSDMEHVNTLLTEYETQRSDYAAAKEKVRTLSNSLEDLLIQQQQAGVNESKEALALERQRKNVEELQEKVKEMEAGGEQTEVVANVSGIVRSINVTSGNKAEAGTALATIEVTDRGYSLSMSVTNEQAQKVRVGDSAEISNYNWGSNISATLTAIRNDPQKPGQGKLLVFTLMGDVESGATLSVSIGQRSQNYDVIVPNSAIREDSNGTFVYVVEARNSPLGNRYFATRVNVTVVAKDDNNSAVTGSLSGWNASVITTSSKPITAGMQVRLAES